MASGSPRSPDVSDLPASVSAVLKARTIGSLRARLLAWYDEHARPLPWRADADPYRVWVSEVMLQQTRVETVIPYYERWLRRFPTVAALADAEPDDVLEVWEGLGYYRRARQLHRAARVLRERYDGRLPADPGALRELPGVGDYTAGAVASIAFGIPAPAVDGNVRRVLSRLFDLEDPSPAELRALAGALVPRRRPGDFNQALMELGATVCVPRTPRCDACPVARLCLARARGTQAERPRAAPRRPVPEVDVGTAVLRAPDGRLLLVRRPDEGLLAGMWEFPGEQATRSESSADAAWRAASPWVKGEVGAGVSLLGVVAHAFTHLKARYHAFLFEAAAVRNGGPEGRWCAPDEAARLALPVAQRKILGMAVPRTKR